MQKRKDGVAFNIYLDRALRDKLARLAEERHQTQTGALEMILSEYFERLERSGGDD